MTIGIRRQRTSGHSRRWARNSVCVAALAAVLLGTAACGGDDSMPDVVGVQEEEAKATLEDLGLVVTVTKKREGTTPGVVLEQTPPAGDVIPEDGKVAIVVAEATPTGAAQIPDVVGKISRDAEAELVDAGFQRGTLTRQFSSEPADTVLDQNPRAGTTAETGTLVDLVVADDTMATVPNVVGDSEGDALRKLAEQRLRVGNINRVLEGAGRVGTVTEQNPRADLQVARDTAVDLVIREDGVRVPDVRNQIVDNVATRLLQSGLQYKFAYRVDPKRPVGTIVNLNPTPNQLVPRNSVVTLTVTRPRGRTTDWTAAEAEKMKAIEQLERKILRDFTPGPGRLNLPINK